MRLTSEVLSPLILFTVEMTISTFLSSRMEARESTSEKATVTTRVPKLSSKPVIFFPTLAFSSSFANKIRLPFLTERELHACREL